MSISKQPIACAFPDGQFNTGSLGRRRNIRINGAIAATLLVLASLSSDQTAAAVNLRSRAPESGTDNSHSHTQQQNKRSLALAVPSFNCPPHHIGYYPTTDCLSYYWCSDGSPANFILYSCADGLLFDVEKGICDWERNVDCSFLVPVISLEEQQLASSQVDDESISNGQSSLRLTHNPTPSPVIPDNIIVEMTEHTASVRYGEAIYFPDFAHRCCRGEKEGDDAFKPTWMTSDHMFQNKERCCTEQFDFINLDECLGIGFVEMNVFRETPPIVEDLGDAGNTTENTLVLPRTPTTRPTTSMPSVSLQPTRDEGVAVQALADTTVSQNNANKNYGSYSMLLVDGGMAGVQQKYDTLVKFDLSFLESGMSFGKVFLRMFVMDAASDFCGRFDTTQNAYWNEDSTTWMNAPTSSTGMNIGEAWNAVSGEWFELDATGVLARQEQKLLSIRISSTEPKRCIFSSTSDPGRAPYLFARFSKQEQETPALPGLTSPPTLPPAPVPTHREHGEALMLFASDDTTISKEEPHLVSGKEATLVVKDDEFSTKDILLKFDIREMRKTTPRSVILMLHVPQNCMSAGVFVSTSRHGNGWTEDTVSWSTSPSFQYGGDGHGTEIGAFGGELEGGKYATFNVIALMSWYTVNYQDIVTIRISSNNGHHCEYTSKEGGKPPKVVMQF